MKEGGDVANDGDWAIFDSQTETCTTCEVVTVESTAAELREEFATLRIQASVPLEFSYTNATGM